MSDELWTKERHAAVLARCDAATAGPWRWTGFCGSPQLEGAREYAEMNPVMVAQGCGNDRKTVDGVQGCMPEFLGDELRACPLHPDKTDRDFVAASRTDLPDALAEIDRLGALVRSAYEQGFEEGFRRAGSILDRTDDRAEAEEFWSTSLAKADLEAGRRVR
jgi:hypothetical protein